MAAARHVHDTNSLVHQDHSARVMQKHQELQMQLLEARQQGQWAFIAYDATHGSKLINWPPRSSQNHNSRPKRNGQE